ncbi:MAG: hypothetical protein IJB70_11390 [Clostridia bacterium]|nr:hypothetical protein [Clostridia bacterium]
MLTLKDYVNWGLTHSDKTADAEGVPLVLENCVRNKKMKQLEVYGNSVQNGTPTPEAPARIESVGELVTDSNNINYGKYKIPIIINGNEYSVIYINEPLRKIGDYADVIDYKNKKVIRKVYENVLSMIDYTVFYAYMMSTGTLAGLRLQYRPAYSHLYMPTDSVLQVPYYALCNQYPVVSTSKRGEHTISGSSATMNFLDIIDSDYTTVDEWDTHIRDMYETGTPLILTQALRTPFEEPITCELPSLPAKTSIVEIDTNLLPSNIKCKYIKR